ncbi:MAG: gas vesicle protein [Chloroflexota bacterium]|nr:gas vesicle protein [Chloroflexota bacterium]MDE3101000.1 gas vesicle protein [Chloroflexota bacterium]
MDRRTFQQPATSIIDILDRVLDKGLVIAGDISVSLANVELLTIRIRLLVCSIDKAEEIGLNWWRYDRNLVAPAVGTAVAGDGAAALEERVATLERQLASAPAPARKSTAKRIRNR